MAATPTITVLAFDYGLKTIGAAVGQSLTQTANPLAEIKANDGVPANWQQIEKLLQEWQPDLCVVGLPLNMDGSPSEMCTRAEKFARRLNGRFGVKVETMDERLSSFEARGDIIERSGSRDFKQQGVDSLSAKIILESWFNQQ
ncbi:Holliday junction resolvase RuvX [Dasania sp. GY-MA-18]|uniref:Putative pre-16S rRNA nuclease n=1 Tax=Dasania phycosphaerae TaxID=2950436 RepID=A0A9J6RKP8_9GAMM|nr:MULTISPECIES: Holliday junction resolvase RuvX [Dasania]MCR8922137.1 Holliday junction resolvase RuvX [Dasania sp. GY-MA-18]MCZ0864565.1 Holliday junction resolvase RuvX [Dasania phycosphaerae]MCZ0868293.1 Holliday junction resolvase RuvX [Dasania phycosphaerae]